MSALTLKQANIIIEKAFAKAREMKIKPLGVVVLDGSGNIVSAQREDGARDRKSTRLNSSHIQKSRMPSSA